MYIHSNIIFNYFCLDTSSIEGYVHLLSDVQSASNSTSSYFDFKIQTSDTEAARAVCYSPKKRVNLQQASSTNLLSRSLELRRLPRGIIVEVLMNLPSLKMPKLHLVHCHLNTMMK